MISSFKPAGAATGTLSTRSVLPVVGLVGHQKLQADPPALAIRGYRQVSPSALAVSATAGGLSVTHSALQRVYAAADPWALRRALFKALCEL